MTELTGGQVRMARAFLRWSIGELAETAGVGLSTVQAIEKADVAPTVRLGVAQTKTRREAVRERRSDPPDARRRRHHVPNRRQQKRRRHPRQDQTRP